VGEAQESAAKVDEWLLPAEAGSLEAEGMERTWRFSQQEIAEVGGCWGRLCGWRRLSCGCWQDGSWQTGDFMKTGVSGKRVCGVGCMRRWSRAGRPARNSRVKVRGGSRGAHTRRGMRGVAHLQTTWLGLACMVLAA